MKAVLLLTTTTIAVFVITLGSRQSIILKNTTIEKEILDIATQFSGRIDLEFLKENFPPAEVDISQAGVPAYE